MDPLHDKKWRLSDSENIHFRIAFLKMSKVILMVGCTALFAALLVLQTFNAPVFSLVLVAVCLIITALSWFETNAELGRAREEYAGVVSGIKEEKANVG